jgi:hypothetical protein
VTALERAREYWERIDASPGPRDLVNLMGTVGALLNAMEEGPSMPMSRVAALKLACEHVEAMSTNSRGFQDGVKMHDKVQATERFARFLMGESG